MHIARHLSCHSFKLLHRFMLRSNQFWSHLVNTVTLCTASCDIVSARDVRCASTVCIRNNSYYYTTFYSKGFSSCTLFLCVHFLKLVNCSRHLELAWPQKFISCDVQPMITFCKVLLRFVQWFMKYHGNKGTFTFTFTQKAKNIALSSVGVKKKKKQI